MRATETKYLSAGLIVAILALVLYIIFQPSPAPVTPTAEPCKVLPENLILVMGVSRTTNQSAPFKVRNQDGTWQVITRLVVINNSNCSVTVESVGVMLVKVTYADGSSGGSQNSDATLPTHVTLLPRESRAWDLAFTSFFQKEPNSVTVKLLATIDELENPVVAEGTYQISLMR